MAEETEVVLSANVTPYEQSVNSATATTNKMLDSVVKLTSAIDGAFRSAGRTMQIGGAGMTAGLVAMGVAAGKLDQQMSQLQASMTMVSKSQSQYEARMKDYEKTVTNLRATFGMTSQEAINLATQLNKLGQSSQNINELATSFTKLSAVTGEGVGQLAASMTQLQRTMGTEGVAQTKNFNATLADLSQRAGVSATAVLQFSQAIAPIAKVSGMTQKEIMGVSTAFNKAGADGYAAASAFQKVATDINKAISTGSPQLQAYADTIGVTVDQLKTMSRVDVMTGFFESINKQGPQAIKTLEKFGLEGVRTYKSIQAVAGSGNMRAQVATAIQGSPTGTLDKASDRAFQGLNDQMNKLAENTKMIGEAFGKGVLPVLEGVAKAVNAIVSPINMVLQQLGKLPGGFALASAAAMVMAGTIVKAFTGLSTFGLLFGAGRTAFQGLRSSGLERAMLTGGDLSRYSQAERAALQENRNFRAGRDYVGSPTQQRLYNMYGRVGERLGPVAGQVGSNLAGTPTRWLGMAQRGTAAGVGFVGSMLRSGLDPLSSNAMANNFNRDQGVQMMPRADVARALGWNNVQDRWAQLRGTAGGGAAATNLAQGMNQAADSTRRVGTVFGQLTRESGLLAKSLIQASHSSLVIAERGAGRMLSAAMPGAGGWRGAGTAIAGAGRGLMGAMGGPAGLAITGGLMGGMALYGLHRSNQEQIQNFASDTTNSSPMAVYAAAVGEATRATKSFTDVMKEAAAAGQVAKYSAKPGADVITAAKRESFTNKALEGATPVEVRSLVSQVMSANPSDNEKKALQADLVRLYGSDAAGLARVENVMNTGNMANAPELTGMFQQAYRRQGFANQFKLNDQAIAASAGVASTIQEQIALSGPGTKQAGQTTIASLNALTASQVKAGPAGPGGSGANNRNQLALRNAARGYAKGILGENVDEDSVRAIADALMDNKGDPIGVQRQLTQGDTRIGAELKAAQAAAGPGYNMAATTLPNMRTYQSGWAGTAGIDQMALNRLRGVDYKDARPGTPGYVDYQQGNLNATATAVFGGSGTGGPGRAVQRALANENDVAAQWTAMKTLSDVSIGLTQSFGEASVHLDEMTAAAGGAATQLGAMAQQARARTRQAQSEEMGYMTTAGRGAELMQNYRTSLAADLSRPSEVTGAHREEDRAAAEAFKQEQFQRVKTMVNSMREFNISRQQAEDDYQLQRGYAEEDFARQREWAFMDYTKNRLRAEQNFNHQVETMAKNTAKTMTNIYERQTTERTWDAANLYQNMADQQKNLEDQQKNLDRLRRAGMSNATIEQMGLNDPANMQQLARLADDMANDPKMVKAFNDMAKKRNAVAGQINTDESNTQWQEMRYQFKRSMDQGEEDYNQAMTRQAEQFENSMDRQATAYDTGMDRSADAFNRSMTEVTGTFAELQKEALAGLSGAAKDQLTAVLDNINSLSTSITAATGTSAREVNALFQSLGIDTGGALTTPGGGKKMTGTVKVGGQTYNYGQFAAGGEIGGRSPHKRADNIPIMATAGEYMLPVDAVQYYGKDFMDAVKDRKLPKFADGGMVYKQMEAWLGKNLPKVQITSSYRPGAITALGNVSMHSQGKALDLAPSMNTFNTILSAFGNKIHQLFYAPADGRTILRGKPWKMDSVTKGDHWNHVHWAMQSMNGLAGAAGVGGGGGWDGTEKGLVDLVQKLASVQKFSKAMDANDLNGANAMGKDWLARKIAKVGMVMSAAPGGAVDFDYNPTGGGSAKAIVQQLAAQRGWTGNQWRDLDQLVAHESSWNPKAQNPTSSAYGLFQFLNSTWKGVGGHKTSDPTLQGKYGLQYIAQRYGNPSKAWDFWNSHTPHWYGEGAVFGGKQQIGVGENGPEAVLPLNQRGVDFLFEVMKRNSSDSKRALVASGGVPLQGNTVSYYSRIDKSTQITGPITVQSQDPDEMLRKLQAKKALETLKGRH